MELNLKVLKIENESINSFKGPLIPLISPNLTLNQIKIPLISTTPLIRLNPFFNNNNNNDWICENFIIKAAFPRSILNSSTTSNNNNNNTVQSNNSPTLNSTKVNLEKVLEEVYINQVKAVKNVKNPNRISEELLKEVPLLLSLNRYTNIKNNDKNKIQNGLTLVFAHANGFHKEIWEPTISELLQSETNSTLPVTEIYSLDCVTQGDSAVLNEEILGNTFTWADNGRDILNFLISYIDSPDFQTTSTTSLNYTPTTANTSTTLPKLLTPNLSQSNLLSLDQSPPPPGNSNPLARRTESGRRIVGIGHSLGGAGIVFAATALPALFSSIILLDPVLPPTIPGDSKNRSTQRMTAGALIRRNEWKGGREEAKEGFLKKPFFASWDSRVLSRYIEFGLKDLKSGGVALKTLREQEGLVFADPLAAGSKRAAIRLASLTPLLPVHFILADIGRSVLDEASIAALLGQVKHSTSVRLAGAAHLVAQEKPKETALEIRKFLNKTYALEEKLEKL